MAKQPQAPKPKSDADESGISAADAQAMIAGWDDVQDATDVNLGRTWWKAELLRPNTPEAVLNAILIEPVRINHPSYGEGLALVWRLMAPAKVARKNPENPTKDILEDGEVGEEVLTFCGEELQGFLKYAYDPMHVTHWVLLYTGEVPTNTAGRTVKKYKTKLVGKEPIMRADIDKVAPLNERISGVLGKIALPAGAVTKAPRREDPSQMGNGMRAPGQLPAGR